MHVRVMRPLGKTLERLMRITLDKRADAELCGESLGEFVLSPHRRLEALQPVVGDEEDERQVEKGLHPRQLARPDFGAQRFDKNIDRTISIRRQDLSERTGDLPRSRSQL